MKRIVNEPQIQMQLDAYYERGGVVLGPYSSHIWRNDPKHLGFLLARYKFCAKMLYGKKEVLEIGCGDSFGTAVVLQTVNRVHGIDIEPLVIEDNIKRVEYGERCSYEVLDITSGPVGRKFDGAFALDVIEHIPPELEQQFMVNIKDSLKPHGVCIIGTPNVTSSQYARPESAASHFNLKSAESLRELLSCYFENVFMFSMNDEVVHTGYGPMAHYLFAIGVGVKKKDV